MEKKFKIGQRVVMVHGCGYAEVGMKGEIIALNPHGYEYAVKFDKKFPGGHSCGGKCMDGYGHNVDGYHIKLIDTVYTTKYKPGDEVTVRSDLTCAKQYYMTDDKNYMYPTDQMLTKRGKKVKIKSVTKTGKYMIEGSIFPWVDEMFVDEAEVKPTGKKCEFKIGDIVEVVETNVEYLTCGKYKGTIGEIIELPINTNYKVKLFDGKEIWCEVKKPTRLVVKCVGYKSFEKLFTLCKCYVWENGTLTADDELCYTELVRGTNPSEWELSEYYEFELVTNPKEIEMKDEKTSTCKFKVGDKVRAIDNRYGVTNLKNKWVGVVVQTRVDVTGDDIRVKHISGKGTTGVEYWVNHKHFKLVEEEPKHDWKITITPDGDKTIATYYEGDKVVKIVDVTRYHEDVYDLEVAAMFVTQKLFAEGRSIITVQFDSGSRKYDYLSKGLAIKRGDRVIVPVGEDNHHVPATVTAIQPFAEDKLHVQLSKMKYVIRVAEDEKPKFKVGDIVIAKKDAPYGITTNGWKGEVVRVDDATWIQVKNDDTLGDGYMVRSEYFDLAKDQTKYYNGKVVCVEKEHGRAVTVGKVYEFVDGKIKNWMMGSKTGRMVRDIKL